MNKSKYNYIASGDDDFSQMLIKSNTSDIFPIKTDSQVLFSTYYKHAIIYYGNNDAYSIGPNTGKQITSNDPKDSKNWTRINLNKSKKYFSILKAVCGSCYTLYSLIQIGVSKALGLYWQNANCGKPFLVQANVNDIFGGDKTAAATTHDRTIIIMSELMTMTNYYYHNPFIVKLPSYAKEVACLDKSIIVLSVDNNYDLIEYSLEDFKDDQPKSTIIRSGQFIDHISGTFQHLFILNNTGEVFARGSNEFGKLGIGKNDKEIQKFTKITAFSNNKIVEVSAGYDHSLFIDEKGAVYSCGKNKNGCLLLDDEDDQKEFISVPVLTKIKSGAIHCVAGRDMSVVVIDSSKAEKQTNSGVKKQIKKQNMSIDDDEKPLKKQPNSRVKKQIKKQNMSDDADEKPLKKKNNSDDADEEPLKKQPNSRVKKQNMSDDDDEKTLKNRNISDDADEKTLKNRNISDDADEKPLKKQPNSRVKKQIKKQNISDEKEKTDEKCHFISELQNELNQIQQIIHNQDEEIKYLINNQANLIQSFNELIPKFSTLLATESYKEDEQISSQKVDQTSTKKQSKISKDPPPNPVDLGDTTTEIYQSDFPCTNSTVFITDMPAYEEINVDFLRKLFEEYDISSSENSVVIESKYDSKGRPFSFAFVELKTNESAKKAVDDMNYMKISNQTVRLIVADDKTRDVIRSQKTALLIKNLDPQIDEKQLHDTLQDFGNVITCKIPGEYVTDGNDGNDENEFVSDECAIVYFSNKKDAKKVFKELKNSRFESRKIKMQPLF